MVDEGCGGGGRGCVMMGMVVEMGCHIVGGVIESSSSGSRKNMRRAVHTTHGLYVGR